MSLLRVVTQGALASEASGVASGSARDALNSMDEYAPTLGIEIRSHSVKGALVDPANGEFLKPGVSVPLDYEGMVDDVNHEDTPEEREKFRNNLLAALQKITAQYDNWTGPVGCSITKAVSRRLGVNSPSFDFMDREVGNIIRTILPDCRRVVTVIHTEAAGYTHLLVGGEGAQQTDGGETPPTPSQDGSSNKLTLMCTIGAALGAVLYNDGHRVRNVGLNTNITATYERDLAELQERFPGAWTSQPGQASFVPPVPCDESNQGDGVQVADVRAWAAWVHLIDDYLLRLVDVARPDELILMPTGGAVRDPLLIERLLPALCTGRFGACRPVVRAGARPEGAIVRGAAIAASVEARTLAGLDAVRAAIRASSEGAASKGKSSGQPRALTAEEMVKGAVSSGGDTPAQVIDEPSNDVLELDSLKDLVRLRAAFDSWDINGDGLLSREELTDGLAAIGVTSPPKALLALGSGPSNAISFDTFAQFWDSEITNAPVTLITSEAEFNVLVGWSADQNGVRFEKGEKGEAPSAFDAPGAGADSPFKSKSPITVLKVGMTFCRPCKSFERKYERYATQYLGSGESEGEDEFVPNADSNAFRFVRVNGNENSSTVHLCRDVLKITRTPTFCLFHNGVEVHRHTGIDADKFERMLRAGEVEL